MVDVERPLGNVAIELADLLESQLLDQLLHDGVFHLQLAVLELTLQHLLGEESLLHLCLLEGQAYLRLGARCLDYVQPVLLGLLVRTRDDFHLVSALQLLSDGDSLSVDAGSHAGIAYLRVDVVRKVKHRCAFREFVEVTLRRKDEHLVFVEIHLELVHHLQIVARLQNVADTRQPLV